MTYISLPYYILVLALFAVYYLLPLRVRWIALLAGNIAFYMLFYKEGWWILLGTSAVCWGAGLLLARTEEGRLRKLLLFVSVAAVVLPWFLVKYFNYFAGMLLSKDPIRWIVPMGISFYTLSLISYVADVYTGKSQPERNFAKFLLFSGFFPVLIQGPISRFGQLEGQLIEGHRFDEKQVMHGLYLILWGFFLKLVIADKAIVIVDTIHNNYTAYYGVYILVACLLYSIQLYADFLACTVLAQGVARLFGITVADNFIRPYFADSIKDFWRRWHVSLSLFLRDYVYIPLGGSRKGKFRKMVNLMITFLVSGFWHGVGFKYLFWGGMHAVFQICGELTAGLRRRFWAFFGVSEDSVILHRLRQAGTFFLVSWALMIFRADSLRIGLRMHLQMFMGFNPWVLFNDRLFSLGLDWKDVLILLIAIGVLIVVGVLQERGVSISERVMALKLPVRWALCMAAVLCILVFGTYGFGFNAQDFVYGGF